MNCPDIEQLIDADAATLEHAETCASCNTWLEFFGSLRAGFPPDVDVPEHLVQATIARLAYERGHRGPWGTIATFLLGAATATPIILTSQQSPSAAGPVTLVFLIAAAALAITLLEPWFVRNAAPRSRYTFRG